MATIDHNAAASADNTPAETSGLWPAPSVTKLTGRDRDAFIQYLNSDPQPSEALLEAARRYKAALG